MLFWGIKHAERLQQQICVFAGVASDDSDSAISELFVLTSPTSMGLLIQIAHDGAYSLESLRVIAFPLLYSERADCDWPVVLQL